MYLEQLLEKLKKKKNASFLLASATVPGLAVIGLAWVM